MSKVLDETGLPGLWEAIINTCPRIGVCSYVGTGLSGSSNATTVTFEFEPKLVFIIKSGRAIANVVQEGSSLADCAILTRNTTSFIGGTSSVSGSAAYASNTVTWSDDGLTVSWYNTSSVSWSDGYQLNSSGVYDVFYFG